MIDIVYPYHHPLAKWDELRYSLRSVEQHFQDDYRVVVIGEKPRWLQNITHIPHERNRSVHERAQYDALTKLYVYLQRDDLPEFFVWMYDDIYLLKDIWAEDIPIVAMNDTYSDYGSGGSGKWQKMLSNTLNYHRKRNIRNPYNYETHMPRIYSVNRMRHLFNSIDVIGQRYLIATLYYNYYYPNLKPPVLLESNKWKAGFYGKNKRNESYSSTTFEEIREAIEDKPFMNHNDAGLTAALQKWIKRTFAEKSWFEGD